MNELYARNMDDSFWEQTRPRCNCGSFALNLTTWFSPYLDGLAEEQKMPECTYTYEVRDEYIEDCLDSGMTTEEMMECVIEKDWEFILQVCPFLEPIQLNDARPTDRVIAYRLMFQLEEEDGYYIVTDQDFHFRVRIGEYWFEKCGSNPVVVLSHEAEETPWNGPHDLKYTGPIKYARFRA